MSSEYFVFDKNGKDQTARRALFSAFVHMVVPDQGVEGDKLLMKTEEQLFGFRKSAGVWYSNGAKSVSWDRRLVLWMRAGDLGYLPFYDESGHLMTVRGRPLKEAAVCTLEVVLRNQALYSTGFLLQPKYKKNQEECISEASSWSVIAYFPFPYAASGSVVTRVDGCVTDPTRIREMLEAHLPPKSKAKRVTSKPSKVGLKRPNSLKPNCGIDLPNENPLRMKDETSSYCSSLSSASSTEKDEKKPSCEMKMMDDFYPLPKEDLNVDYGFLPPESPLCYDQQFPDNLSLNFDQENRIPPSSLIFPIQSLDNTSSLLALPQPPSDGCHFPPASPLLSSYTETGAASAAAACEEEEEEMKDDLSLFQRTNSFECNLLQSCSPWDYSSLQRASPFFRN